MKKNIIQTVIPGKSCIVCKTQLVEKTTIYYKNEEGQIANEHSRVCCPNPTCGLKYDLETLSGEMDIDEVATRR
ncbi:MAG: hypothetical protein UU98_C0017G0014 [Parcubacteria group bacterium GW2011_GWD2_42_14]|nr:MAG: hypothetical protein UU98_C0017G0014 [Parcubacteria group bacterium GW2011_GWD2_42_14]